MVVVVLAFPAVAVAAVLFVVFSICCLLCSGRNRSYYLVAAVEVRVATVVVVVVPL